MDSVYISSINIEMVTKTDNESASCLFLEMSLIHEGKYHFRKPKFKKMVLIGQNTVLTEKRECTKKGLSVAKSTLQPERLGKVYVRLVQVILV